jgi:hypothetical protein
VQPLLPDQPVIKRLPHPRTGEFGSSGVLHANHDWRVMVVRREILGSA